MRRLDRRLATAQARKDLTRLLVPGKGIATIGMGYTAVLLVATTCIYLLLYGALAACVYFGYVFATERAWIGLGLCAWGVGAVMFMLFVPRRHPKGIEGPPARYPQLADALAEVGRSIDAPLPHRILLTPGAEAFVYTRRPVRRLFRRELVLGLGAGALTLLSTQDVKAILAHELAHFRHGDPGLHSYFRGAENALARLMEILRVEQSPSRRTIGYGRGNVAASGTVLAELAMLLLTLPVGFLWLVIHFLRLRESRTAEFAADRVAAQSYGTLAVINGLTGLQVAANTLRNAGQSLVGEMRKHGSANLYAELRNHYAGLPPELVSQLRVRAAQDFRTLQRTHPSTPDRLRAVYGLGIPGPAEPYQLARSLLVPAGATTADAVETELTKLLIS
jgi:Zn-dependent protease with chaperone function